MTDNIIVTLLAAIIAGAAGYLFAIVKRDTAIALVRREQEQITKRLDDQGERIDRHLKVIFRLILDIARKSGVDIRTADAVEIATLTNGDIT